MTNEPDDIECPSCGNWTCPEFEECHKCGFRMQWTLDALAELLRAYRYPYGNEGLLQAAVEQVLKDEAVPYGREVRLTEADRIDFMVGTVGIECKVRGASGSVLSQCLRYAESPKITGLLLLSSRHTHRFRAVELLGKPFRVVWIGGL